MVLIGVSCARLLAFRALINITSKYHFCFTFSNYSFVPTRNCFLSTVGIEPLTIRIVASLDNHYTNMHTKIA